MTHHNSTFQAIKEGTEIKTKEGTFTVESVFSQGGSSIVYKVKYDEKSIFLLKEIIPSTIDFERDPKDGISIKCSKEIHKKHIERIAKHEATMTGHLRNTYKEDQGDMPSAEVFWGAPLEILEETDAKYLIYATTQGKTFEKYLNDSKKNDASKDAIIALLERFKAIISVFNTALWEKDFVHLDIKSSNIYLSGKEESIRILDLANAHCLDSTINEDIINDHILGITPNYSAPELCYLKQIQEEYLHYKALSESNITILKDMGIGQMKKQRALFYNQLENLSIKTDMYSLGMILENTFFKYDKKFLKRMIRFPSIRIIEKRLTQIIETATNENPENRYADAKEFISDLDKCIDILNNRGFYEEVLFKNSFEKLSEKLEHLRKSEKVIDDNLLADIEIMGG